MKDDIRQVKLRGQTVQVNHTKKIVFVTIKKPLGRAFSISDSIYAFMGYGYSIECDVDGQKVILTDKSLQIRGREEVKTHYAGASNWYRYWYAVPFQLPKGQEEFAELIGREA